MTSAHFEPDIPSPTEADSAQRDYLSAPRDLDDVAERAVVERDDLPIYDEHEALLTAHYYYLPRQHSALWDVYLVGGETASYVGTHRPLRDHRNVFGHERGIVKRLVVARIADALGLTDPSFGTLATEERRAQRAARRALGRVVQRDSSGPLHLRKHQYRGWTMCGDYIVTDPIDDVVDVYDKHTRRMLGSFELPPVLRLGTGTHAHTSGGDRSAEATYDRWGVAVVGLRLYCDQQARWLRDQLRPDTQLLPLPADPAQLELDLPAADDTERLLARGQGLLS